MIKFRPHHFLCTLCFQGKGYSPSFIENFSHIKQTLDAPDGDEKTIFITDKTDSICTPCPHRRDQLCEQQEKITELDQAHAAVLGWEVNTTIQWGDAKQQIKDNLTLPLFDTMCSSCSWKSLGLCEATLKKFLPI